MLPNNELKYAALSSNGVSEGEEIGVTADEIKDIVVAFYTKVQQDELLGPVFENEMTEDWDHHLVKMQNFWTAVMFAKPVYRGNPLAVHAQVKAIEPEHFERWLQLFRQTLEEKCPNEVHVDAFYKRATAMGRVMSAALGKGLQSANCDVSRGGSYERFEHHD